MSEEGQTLGQQAYEAHCPPDARPWANLDESEHRAWEGTVAMRLGTYRFNYRLLERHSLQDGEVACIMGREVWILSPQQSMEPATASKEDKPCND